MPPNQSFKRTPSAPLNSNVRVLRSIALNFRPLFLILLLSLGLSGCVHTSVLQSVRQPDESTALIYFIRKSYPPYAWRCDVKVNGIKTANLANNSYAAINVPVGKSEIFIGFNSLEGGVPMNFQISANPNETKYIVLTGKVTKTGSRVFHDGYEVRFRWDLNAFEVSPKAGNEIMSKL